MYPATVYGAQLEESEHVARRTVHTLGLQTGIAFPQLIAAPGGRVVVVECAARIQGGLSSGEGVIYHVRDPIDGREPIRQTGKIVGYQDVIQDQGVKDKRLAVNVVRGSKVVAIEARFTTTAVFPGWGKRIDFALAPRVQTDAARVNK